MNLLERFLLMGVVVLNSIAFAVSGMVLSTHPNPYLFDLMALNAGFVLYAGVVAVEEMEPYEYQEEEGCDCGDNCDNCCKNPIAIGSNDPIFQPKGEWSQKLQAEAEEWYPEDEGFTEDHSYTGEVG